MPVTVEVAAADGRWAVLNVIDEGPGIPAELQERIFERFVKGAESQGLGLGLYLTRRVAEVHSGMLTVKSCTGHGSRFSLALALVE